MPTTTLRAATIADADLLVPLQIAAFHHDSVLYPQIALGGPPDYESVEDMRKKIAEDVAFVIEADGQAVGGIVIYENDSRHIHIDRIFIHPDWHGLGIGTQAMQLLEQRYPQAAKWTLDTPDWAIRNQHFYEKFGYVKVGTNPEPGEDWSLIAYQKVV